MDNVLLVIFIIDTFHKTCLYFMMAVVKRTGFPLAVFPEIGTCDDASRISRVGMVFDKAYMPQWHKKPGI